jgi:hypothetical protein
MKRRISITRLKLILVLLMAITLVGRTQAQTVVIADPGVVSFDITTLADVSVDANALALNAIYKLKLTVFNLDQVNAIPDSTAYIRIGLGSKLILDPAFVLANAPYNNYFTWTSQFNNGQVEIYGILHAPLPPDFIGELSFNIKANVLGTSTVSGNFLVSNNNPQYFLSDSNPNNNSTSLSYTVVPGGGLIVSFDSKTDVTCSGGNNGTITIHASGGSTPYQFSIDGGTSWLPSGGTTAPYTFTGLTSGTYTIRAKDVTALVVILVPAVTLTEPTPITISNSTTVTTVVCPGTNSGSINIVATGGTGSLQYSIDGGLNYFGSGLFTNLASGSYSVYIKDAANCTKDTTISVAPVVVHWVGTTDNSWHNPVNWGNGKVPDALTHVVVDGVTPFNCVISNADAFAASVRVKNNAIVQVSPGRILHIQANCTSLPPE